MSPTPRTEIGLIAWFARNHVAANLLMVVIIAVGLYSAFFEVQRTSTPDIDPQVIIITMVYPGAAPAEVEQGIVLKIEEVLKDIEAIKRVEATAAESLARVRVELHEDYDILAVLDEIKSAVDAITSFPEEAEKPVINRLQIREHAINIQVYGDLDEASMKNLAEEIRTELLTLPDIAYTEIFGARDYEIGIEVPEATLRKFNLSLNDIANAIRASSLDLPGGAIKTDTGEIMLRTKGQAYRQHDFEKVVLITRPDGTRVMLGDIATVRDGFVEQQGFSLFDRKPGIAITVYAVGDQDLLTVARAARQYVADKKQHLPQGVYIDYWADITFYLESRLNMMLANLAMGAVLVFVILAMFLDIKLAFWVMVGLPVCFLGTLALMPVPPVNTTINMISLFGFITVLGIVVDDAIVIGESVKSTCEEKGHSLDNVIAGAQKVAMPATFGVLTTIMAFLPTLFTGGPFASFPAACGWVIILCLMFSLVESKWILPAHLAHSRPGTSRLWQRLDAIPQFCNGALKLFIDTVYRPLISCCLDHRYTTAACFLALLIITAGLVAGGVVRYVMIPAVPADFIRAELEMVDGTTEAQTIAAQQRMQDAIYQLDAEYQRDAGADTGFIRHVFSFGRDGRYADFMLELTKNEERDIDSDEIVKRWRERVGNIPGARVLSFSAADDMAGPALAFKLMGRDMHTLEAAAAALETKLAGYEGSFDIRNGASAVNEEIVLDVKPAAEALGISLSSLATQVRHAFYGVEAQRVQRGNDEIKVMVRFPEAERKTIAALENMYIRSGDNAQVPFASVAEVDVTPGYSKTTRIDSQRAIVVSAQVDKHFTEPSRIIGDVLEVWWQEVRGDYPGVSIAVDGESEETGKLLKSLLVGFAMALFGIYALLAVPLRSYLQPLIIMGVIPFGIIGAVVGHIVIGIPFDMMSFFGVIALSGVVVNDSLIMVDFVNRAVADGESKRFAVIEAGTRRYRAIMLTSLTTFFGLLPMLLETSVQAQLVMPMAVSLAFGIMFATVITLLLIPCLYMILDDFNRWWLGYRGLGTARLDGA
ncbi:MAG: efflux RND transporter permease subunit [Spongiibacteraceae bacterium]|jgi:multidrug efflux pump subunit AcrB|nr:efflux RND transporter permease subunit [Spongiibacteraceae bacterium]